MIPAEKEPKLEQNPYDRIRNHTNPAAIGKIDAETREKLHSAIAGGPEGIRTRLNELNREWDVDRVLITNFSVLVFTQLVLAYKKDKRWLWGPLVQTPFLLMDALVGWCPPLLWFRPMGFRTRFEIQAEREALIQALHRLEPTH